jgi:hypothetical protein
LEQKSGGGKCCSRKICIKIQERSTFVELIASENDRKGRETGMTFP